MAHTKVHFIYASRMGEKYLKRYKKYFRDPEIRAFDMQHEQWLFGVCDWENTYNAYNGDRKK